MKIFIATGTQLAFDRLVEAVDVWAADHPEAEIFAQVGPSGYRPQHMQSMPYIRPEVFACKAQEADVIVAHAGTGTIFTALERRKPIIVMPRLHQDGEHRNDHQMATVERFGSVAGVNVALNAGDVHRLLDDFDGLSRPDAALDPNARLELLLALSDYINAAPLLSRRHRRRKLSQSGATEVLVPRG